MISEYDVIVVGAGEAALCAALSASVLLAQNGIAEIDGVPIVDALAVTVKLAESMVDLRRLGGATICRRGYFGRKPPPQRVEELIQFYGLTALRPPYP